MHVVSPLWYASRGIGLALLLVLTATVVLGTLTSGRWRAEGWPRFLTQELHRSLSLIGLALLPLHGLTVVLDSYARLGLRDILVPFDTAYRPFWLGLGVLAGELLIAVVLSSLVRRALGYGLWRLVHWTAYAVWPLALLHGLGTGSDTAYGWALVLYVGCAATVLIAVLARLALHLPDPSPGRVAAGLLITAGMLAVVIFTMLGPLQPGWAAAAGTPPDLLGGGGTRP
ncbi:MAG TPA: ferric reductase [Candidatus Dormibacteraeota bacterium]|nr:ferric reductase [Candidatus Dormibacteraeota bacterium]